MLIQFYLQVFLSLWPLIMRIDFGNNSLCVIYETQPQNLQASVVCVM